MKTSKGKDKLYAETEMAGTKEEISTETDMMTEIEIMIEG
jgi:hypothetical protein